MSNETEKRHCGAMTLITRERAAKNKRLECYAIIEPGKIEMAAGMPTRFYSPHKEGKLNVFAGGRDMFLGKPETLSQNVNREAEEELQEILQLHLLPAVELCVESQQAYPFIVAQVDEKGRPQFNEIAVTSAQVTYDSIPREIQRLLERAVLEKSAQWVQLQQLVAAYALAQLDEEDVHIGKREARPQLLTAARLYHLQHIEKWETTDIERLVQKWNQRATTYLKKLSKQSGYQINNGIFTVKGSVRKRIPLEDKNYLYPQYAT